jgi:large subunit ribosomal protein L14
MIQVGTRLRAGDNSGAKTLLCLKVLGGSGRNRAGVGDRVVVSVKALRSGLSSRARVTKGSVHRALLLRTKKAHRRLDGTFLTFNQQACALLHPQGHLLGSRLFGPLPEELRRIKGIQLASLSTALV